MHTLLKETRVYCRTRYHEVHVHGDHETAEIPFDGIAFRTLCVQLLRNQIPLHVEGNVCMCRCVKFLHIKGNIIQHILQWEVVGVLVVPEEQTILFRQLQQQGQC